MRRPATDSDEVSGAWGRGGRRLPRLATLGLAAAACLGPLPARAVPPPLALETPGLSSQGGLGLLGMPVAESGPAWQLRTGLWLLGFQQGDFLVAGDRHSSLVGGVQLDASLGRYVEAWLMLGTASNRNERMAPGREDPPLILSLGDFATGVKLHGLVGRTVHLAIQPLLRVSSAGGDLGANFATTSPGVDVLGTLDLRRIRPSVPVRLHLRLGYLQDRSTVVLEGKGCRGEASVDDCVQSRIVTAAAYGIRHPRMRISLGADASFPVHRFSLGPLFEYHLEATANRGDEVVRGYLAGRIEDVQRIEGRVAQWINVGARLHTPIRVTLDAGLQAGLGHPGYAMGPPVPQVAGYAGLTWAADLRPTRPPVAPAGPVVVEIRPGRVHGVVRNAGTGKPLPGAQVRLVGRAKNAVLTDDKGEYEVLVLGSGPIVVEAARDDHEPARAEVQVGAGKSAALDLGLKEKPAPPAVLRVDVVNERNQPLPAVVSLRQDGQRVEAPPDIAGGFLAQAPAGTWSVRVDSEGYLSREVQVVLTQGAQQKLSVVLRKRPQTPAVRLSGDYIAVRGAIGFEPGTADLLPQAQLLLDEVADLLLHHPEIARLRIEGHVDNQGRPQQAQQISEDRAIAVRNYLVKLGVAPERLLAEGLGSSQPLVPNLTPAGRARNRRIVFRVLERQ